MRSHGPIVVQAHGTMASAATRQGTTDVNRAEARVGLLAYGAIGDEHNQAVQGTEGLFLAAVCDPNPERIAAALRRAPWAVPFDDATAMLDSGLVDVVIVSTPPDSHYSWARAALSRGIDVILEKPMALTAEHCDELMDLADAAGLLVVVYQNRRYDADFVTMAGLIESGAVGEVFQYDSFVGGFGRPCDYWHSDAAVSGGAIFDWGSHFLDQLLAVMPAAVAHVSGHSHKRRWTHVTNADHAQVTVTFVDGTHGTFVHSHLAAARQPKFYVLGTTGAIVGDWDPRAEPAVADRPAILTLHREDGTRVAVPLVDIEPYAFHRSVAECLLHGTPMPVGTSQSRDVVAIMQAAEESALSNGLPVRPGLLRSSPRHGDAAGGPS
jgi:scyllo-inositol 2-dehydrogenase (NADP+)